MSFRLEDRISENVGHGFHVGDMVWGKVKSHPWWPGQIYNEALASPSVCETKKEGCVLVAFYGDYSYSWFDPAELIPFDPHYMEKSKQTNAPDFLKAVDDAFYEVRKRAALGLACHCRNPSNFRPTNVQGFVEVDVCGYDPGTLYSTDQIKRARNDFWPFEILSFMKQLALSQRIDLRTNLNLSKNAARVLGYRAAVFEEFDETYAQAFGVQPLRPGNSVVVSSDKGKAVTQVPPALGSMIAEVPCKSQASANPLKVKNPKKKIKNLSKWRDEQKVSQSRAPQVPLKVEVGAEQDANGIVEMKVRALSRVSTSKKAKGTTDIRPLVVKVGSDTPGAQSSKSDAQCKSMPSTKQVKVSSPQKKDKNAAIKSEKHAKRDLSAGSKEKETIAVHKKSTLAKVSSFDELTMLVMKFPHGSRLPSIPELKAKFIRFGPLDISSTRVHWNSSTCQVVFLRKSHAKSAYSYAVNGTLFGDPNVVFRLVELESKSQNESTNACLKNSNGGMGFISASIEDPHVNFMSSAYGSDGGQKSNVLDIESMDQFVDAVNKKHLEFEEMKRQHNPLVATTSTSGVDISSQMMSLLTRCREIVADIKHSFEK